MSSELPDFSSSGYSPRGQAGQGGSSADATSRTTDALNSRTQKRSSAGLVLGIVGGGIVLIVALGLFVSQVAMRSIEAGPLFGGPSAGAPAPTEGDPNREEETWLPASPKAPPPEIFTEAPTTDCTMASDPHPSYASTVSEIRGGGLAFPIPDGWDHPWSGTNVPYLTDYDGQGRLVEDYWYSAMTVGRVEWPAHEGAYPGTEQMAIIMFQCYATHSNVVMEFGQDPEVSNYSSERMTVDGHEAWIVQATYTFDDTTNLVSTEASVVTAIVVETDEGPSAFVSDVAADRPEHVTALEATIKALRVDG